MSAKEILLFRHVQSVTNQTETYQAGDQMQGDPPTQEGYRQIDAIAQRCAGMPIEVVVSSPYTRAYKTAEGIQRAADPRTIGGSILIPVYTHGGIEIRTIDDPNLDSGDGLLREIDLPSILEGKAFNDPAAVAVQDEIKKLRFDGHYMDEENIPDLWERAEDIWKFLERRPEKLMAVVSHGGIIKVMLARLLFDGVQGLTIRQKLEVYDNFIKHTWMDNGSVISIRQEGDTGKWLIGDNAHLPGNKYFAFMGAAAIPGESNDQQNQTAAMPEQK